MTAMWKDQQHASSGHAVATGQPSLDRAQTGLKQQPATSGALYAGARQAAGCAAVVLS